MLLTFKILKITDTGMQSVTSVQCINKIKYLLFLKKPTYLIIIHNTNKKTF